MAKIKKKHTSGAAKNFITRTQAVKKLQVSLADFRRLCIFKGIYPREPRNKKKANKGSTAPTTFYYTKDIQYLMHEPVLQKFRDHKAFAKKLNKALGKGEVGQAKRLDENRPKYKLDHIVKERYPTFLDAVRDLDDPLSMLFLFAAMPATDKISHRITSEAEKLCNQWMAYVARERLLQKVFVSIKGVYYQALVKGQPVLWLVPFKFPQNVPSDVDFKIMCTFLEFYTTLLQFVLYKLYIDSDLVYPPRISAEKVKGVGGITSYVLESQKDRAAEEQEQELAVNKDAPMSTAQLKLDKALKADKKHAKQEDESADQENGGEQEEDGELDEFTAIPATETAASDVLAQPKKSDNELGNLFAKFTFFIGREVPLDIIEFLITAFGGRAISEAAMDELIDNEDENASNDAAAAAAKVDLSGVTHQICDRPSISHKVPGRTYIQPQWIFDCINKGEFLPVADYAPGETLPPHLSPWGDAAGYDPEAAAKQDGEESESESDSDYEEETVEGGPDEEEEDEEDDAKEVLERQKELEQEAAGVSYSKKQEQQDKKSKKRSLKSKEDEDKELRKIMMSNKQKKLYNKMQYGIKKNEDRDETLRKKRRKLDKLKEQADK